MMQMRSFGRRSGFTVPRANIGAMRLPKEMDAAVALIRQAIDAGMRYIDTCRCYGDSELKLAQALQDGYRKKVILSTKWSPWIRKIEQTDDTSADCVRRRIEESMRRLGVDYLDFYQVWNIDSAEHWAQATAKGGMVEGIQRARAEGLVGHIGFTTHDQVEHLLQVLPQADWAEVMLVSYNLLNTAYAPVLAKAHALGIGTIVMNPVGGGRLAQQSAVLQDLAGKVGTASVPDLAIRYIMSDASVDTIISGISRPEDVRDSWASAAAGALAPGDLLRVEAFLDQIATQRKSFCTGCRYCLPCPQGIDIPKIMAAIFDERVWGLRDDARKRFQEMQGPKPEVCAHCGSCEEKCPQHLDIMDELEYANTAYAVT